MPSPIKSSLKTEWLPVMAILAAFAASIYFYAHFPAQVALHWDLKGHVNRYGSRFEGAFIVPLILLGIYILFLALPFIDPRRERYEQFGNAYHSIKDAVILMMLGVHAFAGMYNLGYNVKVNFVIPILVGLLLIFIGNLMGKVKRNWFVGVRTPWTLSSENVWNKTNRFGGWMMVVFGILIITTPFLPKTLGIAVFVIGALLVALGSFVYSYLEFQKEKKETPQEQ